MRRLLEVGAYLKGRRFLEEIRYMNAGIHCTIPFTSRISGGKPLYRINIQTKCRTGRQFKYLTNSLKRI